MSKPVFKILLGTVIVGKVKTKAESAELLDRLETDLCKLSFIASVASLLPNEEFEELMSKNIQKLKSLKRLTIPTESYELYRAWVKLNENSPVALVYSADDPSECFTLTAEAAEEEIECQGEAEASETYEALKEFYAAKTNKTTESAKQVGSGSGD
ncbi:hypothetical protein [Parasutterella excrementihominis]|uniref:hypothetical protein n=1 Tax=Parasutterella excrementihominis TaxID=487175 RepID=UPI003522532C